MIASLEILHFDIWADVQESLGVMSLIQKSAASLSVDIRMTKKKENKKKTIK